MKPKRTKMIRNYGNKQKNAIGWNRKQPPVTLVQQGKAITNTTEIANTLNREQILRSIRLRRQVPATVTDPMENYQKAAAKMKSQ